MAKDNYYEVLGLDKNASEDDIKTAYRKAASLYHPDKPHAEATKAEAEENFKTANEAYEILADPKKRAAYDHYGLDGLGPGPDRAPKDVPPPVQVAQTVFPNEIKFVSTLEDFSALAALAPHIQTPEMLDQVARVKEVQHKWRSVYSELGVAYAIYKVLTDTLDKMGEDVRSSSRPVSEIEENARLRIQDLQKAAGIYQDGKAKEAAIAAARVADYKRFSERNKILQPINEKYGEMLSAFHINVSRFDKTTLEKLSQGNAETRQAALEALADGMKAQGTSKKWTSLLGADSNESIAIKTRVHKLREMFDQYGELAHVFAELGYKVGEGYDPKTKHGDIKSVVSDILREIKEVPLSLQKLQFIALNSGRPDPLAIFKDHGLFEPKPNEPEINALLTPDQRRLVMWVQAQANGSENSDEIDEDIIIAALSENHQGRARRNIEDHKIYISKVLVATDLERIPEAIGIYRSTKDTLEALAMKMDNLFEITSEFFEKHAGDFDNCVRTIDLYISFAETAGADAALLLAKGDLLTRDEMTSVLKEIDPKFKVPAFFTLLDNLQKHKAVIPERALM